MGQHEHCHMAPLSESLTNRTMVENTSIVEPMTHTPWWMAGYRGLQLWRGSLKIESNHQDFRQISEYMDVRYQQYCGSIVYKIYTLPRRSLITVVSILLASSREIFQSNDPKSASSLCRVVSVIYTPPDGLNIPPFWDNFAFNSSLRSLIFSENIAIPFLNVSSAFGAMGRGWLEHCFVRFWAP